MNYFEFFDLPISFSVDAQALRARFYENSKKYHPDFFTLADEAEQARVLELASRNNEAYRTLADPDKRMRYILVLHGLLAGEDRQSPLPQDFLMDMMDINENLMELEADFDAARYEQTRQAVEALQQQLDASIAPVLQSWSGDAAALEPVRDYYLKKRYLLRIRENLSKFAD
jgi:molecular chaperone HscB